MPATASHLPVLMAGALVDATADAPVDVMTGVPVDVPRHATGVMPADRPGGRLRVSRE